MKRLNILMVWNGLVAATLVACGVSDTSMSEQDIRRRAEVIRVCPGGMLIGRDPVSQRLTWGNGWVGGMVANGVTPEQVCKR